MTAPSSILPLVTGGTGFAGSHLIDRLLESNDRIAAWSHAGGAEVSRQDDRVVWSAVDLTDAESIARALSDIRPTAIYHCAGLPHVAEAWAQSGKALRVNAHGTHLLLQAARDADLACPIVVTGSALVYRPSVEPLQEDAALAPSDPYGLSKLAQEMVALRSPLRVIVARPFNHAGPRQPSAFVTSSFARQIAEIESGLREPVIHVGNLDAKRDITDVRDTVRAYEALARAGAAHRVYNVCSGVAHRVGDLLEKLLGMAQVGVRIEQDPARLRPSDNPVVLGDASRIAVEVGWQPEIPIEDTLSSLLAWWRSRTTAGTHA